ncbi:MAG: hypothetical protein ACYDCO_19670 [Armatimonadota bacterium]
MPEQPQPSPQQAKTGCLQTLRTVFLVTAAMPIFFFISRGPAENKAQLWFRLGSLAVGVVGALVVHLLMVKAQREAETSQPGPYSDTEIKR